MKTTFLKLFLFPFYALLQFALFGTMEGAHYSGLLSLKIAAILLIALLAVEAWQNIRHGFLKVLYVFLPFVVYWVLSLYFSGILRFGGTFYDLGVSYFLIILYAFGIAAFKKVVQRKWRLWYFYPAIIVLIPALGFVELPFNIIDKLRGKAQIDLSHGDFKNAYSEVFKNIKDNYYYFDLDERELADINNLLKTKEKWDSTRFDREMERLRIRIDDAHFHYDTPQKESLAHELAGIWFCTMDGKQVVRSVHRSSESFKKGILPGFILTGINHQTVDSAVRSYYRNYKVDVPQQSLSEFTFKTMLADLDSLNLTFLSPENEIITVSYGKFLKEPGKTRKSKYATWKIYSTVLKGNIGYIRFDKWVIDPRFIMEFDKALEKVWNTKGLIFDLRGNNGGFPGGLPFITGRFTEKPLTMAEVVDKESNEIRTIITEPRSPVYSKKVIVLIDEGSVSATGLFIIAAKKIPHVEIVGKPSLGVISYPTKYVFFPQGRSMLLYNGGIVLKNTDDNHRQLNPHFLIPHDLDAITQKRDHTLEIALKRF